MENPYAHLKLRFNPFEPSASGAPIDGTLSVPERWSQPLRDFLETMTHTSGPKAYAILGEYGSGKTYLLRWLEQVELPKYRIRSFFFDNPGSRFYDLANTLLRQIGRENFAKTLWEFLNPELRGTPLPLFKHSFEEWLRSVKKFGRERDAIKVLAQGIQSKGIASDAEICHKLARLIAETYERPYFEYRDFLAGRRDSLVAEGEEAPYFAAILRALRVAGNTEAIAFLLDEFEEVSLQKQLTKREAHEYLATMKRLIGLTEREQFWVIVAMTPQAAEITEKLEPALWQRFTSQGRFKFEIPPLNDSESKELVQRRLAGARPREAWCETLFPFPEQLIELLRQDIKSSPRRLVKVCSLAVARACQKPQLVEVPFTKEYFSQIQEELYPIVRGEVIQE